jgi:hypothetical protein
LGLSITGILVSSERLRPKPLSVHPGANTSVIPAPLQIGRSPGELSCKLDEVQIVSRLEAAFSDRVLLDMMTLA